MSRGEVEELKEIKKWRKSGGYKKSKLRWTGRKERKEGRTFHEECSIDGETFRCNDVVLVRSGEDLRVARIECMWAEKPGKKLMKCRWLYRPEDLLLDGTALEKVGERELFLSHAYSVRDLLDVAKKCQVYTPQLFEVLGRKEMDKMEGDVACVFFCHRYYSGALNFQEDVDDERKDVLSEMELCPPLDLSNSFVPFSESDEPLLYAHRAHEPPSRTASRGKKSQQETIYCCIQVS